MSKTSFNLVERELIEAHIASGQPRYSSTFYLLGGGYIRSWSDDREAVLARHAADRDDPRLSWVITFDHLAVTSIAVDFPPEAKTADQLRAECDEALEQMFERWEAEARQ
ncbi:F-actin-capping protein subunit alpha [Caulobacter endophyticus]|uniref:Uncharacterized protein n=1 Tax=Caulobacter endophyticus TaxID=2172652 RepID=A0A2T9JXY5_9CAUL|nr:hypothetical protein [Caulobacter endophyticus]PVM88608.1 hypothetical protein DDF67_13165 [Caulobacter endophyticus]